MHIYVHTYIWCVYIYIYTYMVPTPPPHELPTLVLYRNYRVKPAFPAGPDSVSLEDCQNPTHMSRERPWQIVQVRREHALNGNTVLFQSRTNFFLGNQQTQNTIFWETIRPNSKKDCYLVFPRKRLVFGATSTFFLGKRWFWDKKTIIP